MLKLLDRANEWRSNQITQDPCFTNPSVRISGVRRNGSSIVKLAGTDKWLNLIANIGVLVGIVFLAYEIQQNTIATQLEVASSFQSSFSEVEMLIAVDSEFAELLFNARIGAEINPQEQFRIATFYGNVLRTWQNVHFQYLSDSLDVEIWRGEMARFAQILSEDRGLREHWRLNQNHYSQKFNELIKNSLSDLTSS